MLCADLWERGWCFCSINSGGQSSGEVKPSAAIPQDPCINPQHLNTGFISSSVPLDLINHRTLGGVIKVLISLRRPTKCTLPPLPRVLGWVTVCICKNICCFSPDPPADQVRLTAAPVPAADPSSELFPAQVTINHLYCAHTETQSSELRRKTQRKKSSFPARERHVKFTPTTPHNNYPGLLFAQ